MNRSGTSSPEGDRRLPLMFATSLATAKANLRPGVLLWIVGCVVVGAFYFLEPARPIFDAVGDAKLRYGYWFSLVSTATFAGLVPWSLQFLQRGRKPDYSLARLVFLLVLWAEKGVEVDLFYRVQSWLFGDDVSALTVVAKVLVDQLVYAPLLGLLTVVLAMAWADAGYSLRRLRRRLSGGGFCRLYLPALLSNNAVWIPGVSLIYILPLQLQVPMQNLVACFWALVLMSMSDRTKDFDAAAAPDPVAAEPIAPVRKSEG